MTWHLKSTYGLSHDAHYLFLYLSSMGTHPSSTMANMTRSTGLSVRAARHALYTLRDKGMISFDSARGTGVYSIAILVEAGESQQSSNTSHKQVKKTGSSRSYDLSTYQSMTWESFWSRLQQRSFLLGLNKSPNQADKLKYKKMYLFCLKHQPKDLSPEIVDAFSAKRIPHPISFLCSRLTLSGDDVVAQSEILNEFFVAPSKQHSEARINQETPEVRLASSEQVAELMQTLQQATQNMDSL